MFNTSNVINMRHMFSQSGVETLDVSSFDTSKVTDMSYMFNVIDTVAVDLTNFNTSQVTAADNMFKQNTNHTLTNIYTGNDFDLLNRDPELNLNIPKGVSTDPIVNDISWQLVTNSGRFRSCFLISLPTGIKAEKYGATVSYKPSGSSETVTETLTASDYKYDGNEYASLAITCAAKNMNDNFTISDFHRGKIQINSFNDGNVTAPINYNPATALKTNIIGSANFASYHNAAKSMLRYGAAAQTYFNYNTSNLANAGIEGYSLENSLSDVSPECTNAFTKAAMTGALETLGVEDYFEGYSAINMTFTADTTLMLAFRYADTVKTDDAKAAADSALEQAFETKLQTDCGVTAEDVTVEPDLTGNYAVLRVKNVPLMKLDTPIFIIGSGDDVVEVRATQYLAQVGNSKSEKVSADLKNLCKALYKFYDDARNVPLSN